VIVDGLLRMSHATARRRRATRTRCTVSATRRATGCSATPARLQRWAMDSLDVALPRRRRSRRASLLHLPPANVALR
jgi:hypothetical protein